MKKHIFPLLILAFLATLVLSSCGNYKKGAAQGSVTNADKTAASKHQADVYLMAGKIDANEKADLTSKMNAKVIAINVDVGSTVKKGDPVIRLDTNDLEAQVAQAQAGVNTARANLTKIQSGVRPEQESQAQAALDGATINYQNAKINFERNQQLFNGGLISKSQLEQYQTVLAAAEASYKSAKEALNILQKGETPETINIYQAQLKQAQAALKLATTQSANGIIVSPISGVVSAKNINPGELAAAGAPLVTVVNSESVVVNAYLPAGLLDKIRIGMKVVIWISELPNQEFKGEIAVIDPVIDSKNKNVLVKVKFLDQDPSLKPGMFAEVGLKN